MKTGFNFNRKGFATISLLLFLPLLGSLIFSLGFMGYLIQHKTKIRSTCLTEGRAIQKTLIQNEENLFKLNPSASTLRLQLESAQTELILAAENPVWFAEVKAKIAIIQTEQRQLDLIQQTLIKNGNLQAQIKSASLLIQLNQLSQSTNQIWSFYLQILTKLDLAHTPKMAVVRDSAEPAPIYELDSDYKEKQRLAYRWQTRFETKSGSQRLLKSENDIELYCAVSAKNERNTWTLLIDVDKS